jgi:hypothetical protein
MPQLRGNEPTLGLNTAPGGKETRSISARTFEASVRGREDEKVPVTLHGSAVGPCHLE